MSKNKIIVVKGISITTFKEGNEDFFSLTDIARYKNAEEPKDVVKNWMRSRTTIEFLGIWEELYNADFKGVEFDSFMFEAGRNSFTLSPSKWIKSTNANRLKLEWNLQHTLAKVNYHIHTDAIRENLIPPALQSFLAHKNFEIAPENL